MEGLEAPARYFGEYCKFMSKDHMKSHVRKIDVAICVYERVGETKGSHLGDCCKFWDREEGV